MCTCVCIQITGILHFVSAVLHTQAGVLLLIWSGPIGGVLERGYPESYATRKSWENWGSQERYLGACKTALKKHICSQCHMRRRRSYRKIFWLKVKNFMGAVQP